MRWVDTPHAKPSRCAVLPYVGPSYRTRWIDTGSELTGFDGHVYVSEIAAVEIARMIGFTSRTDHSLIVAERDRLAAEVADLRDRLAEAERVVAAVDLLESKDFTSRRKPGRPRRNEVEA